MGLRQRSRNAVFFFAVMTAVFLTVHAGPASAAENKKEAPPKAPAPVAAHQIPEITRIAVIRDMGRERFLQNPLAIARDSKNGDLFATNFAAGEVVIIGRDGTLVKRMGADSGLVTPYGIALDGKGRIYVSEIKTGFLKIFSPIGAVLEEIDLGKVMGKAVSPGRIMLGENGLLYVADLGNKEIIVLNGKGEFVRSMGHFEFLQKAGVINGDRIIGLSAYGKTVQIFNRDGVPVSSFGTHSGESSDSNFSFPSGFAVDAKGRLWIADAFQHRLKVFTPDGKFLFNYGSLEEKGSGFFFPVDLCFGEDGELIVLEKGGNRIQIFQVSDLKE